MQFFENRIGCMTELEADRPADQGGWRQIEVELSLTVESRDLSLDPPPHESDLERTKGERGTETKTDEHRDRDGKGGNKKDKQFVYLLSYHHCLVKTVSLSLSFECFQIS